MSIELIVLFGVVCFAFGFASSKPCNRMKEVIRIYKRDGGIIGLTQLNIAALNERINAKEKELKEINEKVKAAKK